MLITARSSLQSLRVVVAHGLRGCAISANAGMKWQYYEQSPRKLSIIQFFHGPEKFPLTRHISLVRVSALLFSTARTLGAGLQCAGKRSILAQWCHPSTLGPQTWVGWKSTCSIKFSNVVGNAKPEWHDLKSPQSTSSWESCLLLGRVIQWDLAIATLEVQFWKEFHFHSREWCHLCVAMDKNPCAKPGNSHFSCSPVRWVMTRD